MLADDRRCLPRRPDRRGHSLIHPASGAAEPAATGERAPVPATPRSPRASQHARSAPTSVSAITTRSRPSVVLRLVMENPGWYTPYTPYQAEIAQGRLESLINFQTMVTELTGMEVSNASLLDEATAAAEAMTLLHRVSTKKTPAGERALFLVSDRCFPQTIEVLRSRAEPLGIDLHVGPLDRTPIDARAYGVLLQYPDESGLLQDLRPFIASAHEAGVLVAVGADLLSLAIVTPPGEMGADVVFGTSQRFGVPLGFGGPHAAFFATRHAVRPPDARPHHRRLGGRPRAHGVSHGAGHARAAHPAREGDVEHLHRAGAARQHGGHVCRLSRARRPARDRLACAPDGAARRAVAHADGPRAAQRGLFRHRAHRRALRRGGRETHGAGRRDQLPLSRRSHGRTSRSTKRSPLAMSSTSSACSPPRSTARRRTWISSSCPRACSRCTPATTCRSRSAARRRF